MILLYFCNVNYIFPAYVTGKVNLFHATGGVKKLCISAREQANFAYDTFPTEVTGKLYFVN